MMLYDLPAPAKLNLFLHVVGRRADGYHLLQTVFQLISLSDTLDIDVRADGLICRETDLQGVSHDDDLVVRAARLLQKSTGVSLGAQIQVRKQIPSGAGLGGGSSDAATVLMALNRLWRTGLSRGELMRLGLQLGADVPVFIFGQNAFAEGVGEQLTPLELPRQAFVVIQPAQGVPTQGIFQAPDLTRDTEPVKIMDFSGRQAVACLGFGHNDLQPVVLSRYPVVRQALDWLEQAGFNARMTGSGSCFFVGFRSNEQAEVAYQKMLAKIHVDFSDVASAGLVSAAGSRSVSPIQAIKVCEGIAEHPLRHWSES
ncbi:4-(cytidine 5'-diphospho)-2-C-methyl-D-erythritol kinase [Zwartia vadi]|uniref:4-(cytidine 5'-diphospho)-2-C-methyl-D-erythritol kinase n=1 Tax=Zwartia vadi TaxID=3058168 RepID=UPI0025B4A95F|nr:4-(cytidine 5'-diphospho)-2-C-methyl-D-erythritol kinase [Zwartia vadi]MDN3988485.1 4-(cytidine 5'-diphospho)-2-C-methyl-D-erythritol kinase [Zwartia vadi]